MSKVGWLIKAIVLYRINTYQYNFEDKTVSYSQKIRKEGKYAIFGIFGLIILLILGVVFALWDLNTDILAQIPSTIVFSAIIGKRITAFS